MWGYISTEASYQMNFNTGFSTTRSDVMIHLAQWQYWWWFWFAFLWAFYYLLASRIVRFRTLKMRPKIVTSYRPHGKWGDFLAAIVPLVWCINILTNSNFILRLIEWQNESTLFTIRIRARQWYWIYKYELKSFFDILTTPKNIGHNRWCINVFGDLQVGDDYLHLMQLRSQNRWIKSYWGEISNKLTGVNKVNNVANLTNYVEDSINTNEMNLISNNFKNTNLFFDYSSTMLNSNLLFNPQLITSNESAHFDISLLNLNYFKNNMKIFRNTSDSLFASIFDHTNNDANKMFSDVSESSRLFKRQQGVKMPARLIKFPVSNMSLDNDVELFRIRFQDGDSTIMHKNNPHSTYLTLKQKRYKRKKNIPAQVKYYKDAAGIKTKRVRYSGKPILINNSILEDSKGDLNVFYRLVKKNKKRSDLIPVTLAKRILRTKKILVLPAHVNISLITNSYDIVHSWFVPGLGIKLDCVPGRSTHHSFYIDNVGLYYGQCAEICGRYHHHMPIRLCALPFEHFLVWWHSFGLPKLLYTTTQKKFETYYAFRKFSW